MGIMSDRTKQVSEITILALVAGLEIAGQSTIAALIKSQGMTLVEAGYNYLGMTDEVTVKVDGEVTGTIKENKTNAKT